VPLYEYQCPQCGRFEVIRKFSDPPLTSCPTCSKEIAKLPSAPAFHLKGTGWYVTDYAKKSSSGDGANSSSSSKEGSKDSKDSSKEASKTSAPKDVSQSPPSSTSKDSPASGSGTSK
jgi:putative FmdB family regulatory protein